MKDCEKVFLFTEDGYIEALNGDKAAQCTIDRLNLNVQKLVNKRKKVIEDKLYKNTLIKDYDNYDDFPEREYISAVKAREELEKLEKRNENGNFAPFVSAIRSTLKQIS